MVDDFAGSGYVVGLERRGRIGDVKFAVDAKPVTDPGGRFRNLKQVPAVVARLHRAGSVEYEFNAFGGGSPNTKADPGRRQLRPKGKLVHVAPANTRTERGGACMTWSGTWLGRPAGCVVSSRMSHRGNSISTGSLNSIAWGAALRTM